MAPALAENLSPFVIDTRGGGSDRAAYGYDAIESRGRRKAPSGLLRSEDQELLPEQRRRLLSAIRDIPRNFAAASWMIRKHLDYVSSFHFMPNTGNSALNEKLDQLVEKWSRPENCDVAGRHDLSSYIRLAEARRTIDGDVFIARLKNKQLQAIEGDRVRTPYGGLPQQLNIPWQRMRHGVLVDEQGKALQFAVSKRLVGSDFNALPLSGGFLFERMVSSQHVYQHAYFDRFDQIRGISPLAPALNTLRDVYEGFDYALAKAKIAQLFGLVFTREAADDVGETSQASTASDPECASGQGAVDDSKYVVDFGGGPFKLELDPGDKAEFLTNDTPGKDFQSFSQVMLMVSLKALDIPYSYFSENFTTYTGGRQAMLQYEDSCVVKRRGNQRLLEWITMWLFLLSIDDGELPEVDPAMLRFDWIPRGMPWIDPETESQADINSIGAVLDSRTLTMRRRGLDFRTVARQVKEENDLLEQLKLTPNLAQPIQIITGGKNGKE